MFVKTDVPWAPWYVTVPDDKKRARLNIISQLLDSIDSKDTDTEKVILPKRKVNKKYQPQEYLFRFIPEVF